MAGPLRGSDVWEKVRDLVDEFGDGPVEMLDTADMEYHASVTTVIYDQERQRIVILSDR
jgi:hypothetical protein